MSPNRARPGWRDLRSMLLLVGGFLVLAGVAIGIAYAVKSPGGPAGDIQASTVEFKIRMPTVLSPGKHTIGLTNDGTVGHEVVLFKTDLPANGLPTDANGEVEEESPLLQNVGDSGESLPPGDTKSFPTANLTPGHYVAVCNLPGHYKSGMWLNVTVT